MKYILGFVAGLFITTAYAADMPQKAPSTYVAPAAELFQGWWLGVGVGYGTSKVEPDIAIGNFKPDGIVAGGSVGYRAQIFRQVYLGLDGTLNFSDMNDNQSFGPIGVKVKNTWYGTAGLSLGYAIMPDLLVSGTAGAVYGNHKAQIRVPGFSVEAKDSSAGWYVGASADYALASMKLPGWTVGVDYKHITYMDTNFGFPIAAGITIGTKADIHEDVVMVTGKYRFGL